jgi:ABC-type antimicrobial peptide transport system permease subunit
VAGLAIGLVAGWYLKKLAADPSIGLAPVDTLTVAAVGGVLVAAALAACLIPARRAMRVDPVVALRD